MEFFRHKHTGKNGVEISIPDDPRPAIGSIVLGMNGKNAHIGYVYVREDSRRGGYGELLVSQAEVWAKRKGSRTMTADLTPVPGCELAIRNLLSGSGFEIDKNGKATKQLK